MNTAFALDVSGDKTVVPLIVGKPDLSRLPLIRGKDYLEWRNDPKLVALRLREVVARHRPEVMATRVTGSASVTPSVPAVAPPPQAQPAERQRSWLQKVFGKPR